MKNAVIKFNLLGVLSWVGRMLKKYFMEAVICWEFYHGLAGY
jgi:hypothetical protein